MTAQQSRTRPLTGVRTLTATVVLLLAAAFCWQGPAQAKDKSEHCGSHHRHHGKSHCNRGHHNDWHSSGWHGRDHDWRSRCNDRDDDRWSRTDWRRPVVWRRPIRPVRPIRYTRPFRPVRPVASRLVGTVVRDLPGDRFVMRNGLRVFTVNGGNEPSRLSAGDLVSVLGLFSGNTFRARDVDLLRNL